MDGGPAGLPASRPIGTRKQLLAVLIGVLPLYAGTILRHFGSDRPISTEGFVLYLAVISPLAIGIALFLLRALCGESPRDLNLRRGTLSSDLIAALLLVPLILAANIVSNGLFSRWFTDSAADTSVRDLFADLARNPGLLALILVLLIPLGAASEEVIRVFLLSRLWRIWPSITGRAVAVALSACLFGLIHAYRGPSGMASTTVYGLITALYYLRFGRVVPLILAHAVTNDLQVVLFAAAAR